MPVTEILAFSNPVFSSYVFYSSVVIVKMMLMSLLTAAKRMASGTFVTQEDADIMFGKGKVKPAFGKENIEKVRRNHRNDLENIPPFVMLGLLYVLSQPAPSAALWHFRLFAAFRILHTVCYQGSIPQPSRAIAFVGGLGVCISMAAQLLLKAQ